MSAKEMFEKLGYEDRTDNEESKYKIVYEKDDSCVASICYRVAFYLENKRYVPEMFDYDDYESSPLSIDIDLARAIDKQREELGWN